MNAVIGLFGSLAVLFLGTAGLAAIVGWKSARNALVRYAVALFLLGLFLPAAFSTAAVAIQSLSNGFMFSVGGAPESVFDGVKVIALAGAILLGHIVLGVVLLRRRFGGAERARRDATDIERARSRERVRIPVDGGGGDR